MKRILLFLLVLIMLPGLVSCKKKEEEDTKLGKTTNEPPKMKVVSLFLPNQEEQRWEKYNRYMGEICESWGIELRSHTADFSAETQVEQIRSAISGKTDCIAVAAIDCYSPELLQALADAKAEGIPVIAFDRLIMNTPDVDVFVTFDTYLAGRESAIYLLEKLRSRALATPYYFEVYLGTDINSASKYFYSGVMDYLIPVIDRGEVILPVSYQDFYLMTRNYEGNLEQRLKDELAVSYGAEKKVDAIIAMTDDLSAAALKAAKGGNYGRNGEMPYISGVGCYTGNVISMRQNERIMSVFEDERVISRKIMDCADKLMSNQFPKATDKTTFNNGEEVVPAVVCEVSVVDVTNWEETLAKTNYYSYVDLVEE